MKKESGCNTRSKALFLAAIAFIVVLLLPIASAYSENSNITTLTPWTVVVVIAVILFVFSAILLFGYFADQSLNTGEMRRAIAGAFVIGFFIITVICINYNILKEEVVLAFINSVGIVIGFYFGSKTAVNKESEAKEQIDIENVNFINNKKAKITLRNKGNNIIKVDKIYVADEAFDGKEEDVIPSKKSREIEINLTKELKPDNGYKVKAVTSNGVPAETTKTFKNN